MSKAELLPAYLIIGADEYKRSHAVSKMRARLEESGMAAFNLDERDMTKDPAIDDIIASLNTYPMGSEFRLVILDGCDKLPKAVSEPLVEYLASPAPTTVCLLVANSLAKNTRLYKAVAKVGAKAVIDCAPKKAWEMPKQVVGMARHHGKTMGLPAAEALVSARRGVEPHARQRVGPSCPDGRGAPITLTDVERLVVRTAEVKPWDLLNAVSRARYGSGARASVPAARAQQDSAVFRCSSHDFASDRRASLDARGAGSELAHTLGVQSWQVKNHLAWSRT